MDLSSSLCSNLLLAFRISCLTFYIELCSEIKMRVNHKDDTLIQLQCIDPKGALSSKVLSIAPLFYKFRSTLTLDIEEINTEWRQLSKLETLLDDIKTKMKTGTTVMKKKGKKLYESLMQFQRRVSYCNVRNVTEKRF